MFMDMLNEVDSVFEVILKNQEQKEAEVKEMRNDIKEMTTELNNIQLQTTEYEDKNIKEDEEIAMLKIEEQKLKKYIKTLGSEIKDLLKEIKVLEEESQPSEEDKQILEKTRKLLKLYKDMTGIKWDYTAPTSEYCGCVFNPDTMNCCQFHFTGKHGSEKVWKEIDKAAHKLSMMTFTGNTNGTEQQLNLRLTNLHRIG